MIWSSLSPEEIERRRLLSVEAMKGYEKAEFDQWYQSKCDSIYWNEGQCCAGCDHWSSERGLLGQCAAAGIVSGLDVRHSLIGNGFCSAPIPEPGLPFSKARLYCDKFKDEFDWSTLDQEYLEQIGATHFGRLKPKPSRPIPEIQRES